MAEKESVPTLRVKGPTFEECAAKTRKTLGEAGAPIAEGILALGALVKGGTDEMRGYAAGAKGSAAKSETSAKAAEASAEAMKSENTTFIAQLREHGATLDAAAARVEGAVDSLTYGEAKGAEALKAVSKAVEGIPDQVKSAVAEATYIDVIIPQTDGSKVIERKSGGEALAYMGEYLAHVSQAAGDALGVAKEAKAEIAQLLAGVQAAFAAVDEKITLIMFKAQEAGAGFSPDEEAAVKEPSFKKGDTDG